MKPEPLKDKREGLMWGSSEAILLDDVKSAVQGLIKFHEDSVDKAIKDVNSITKEDLKELNIDFLPKPFVNELLRIVTSLYIEAKYESITAIEYWLEDVIEKEGKNI